MKTFFYSLLFILTSFAITALSYDKLDMAVGLKNDLKAFPVKKAGGGCYSSVSINNNGVVVEVHKSTGIYYDLYYSVGKLEDNKLTMYPTHRYENGSGQNPSVSINDKGLVVEVHEGCSRDGKSYFRIGKINESKIDWKRCGKFSDHAVLPSVSINNDGYVVIMFSDKVFRNLYCLVGKANKENTNINFGQVQYMGTYYHDICSPHWYSWAARKNFKAFTIALNDPGDVVEVHVENEKDLHTRVGTLDMVDKTIKWKETSKEAYDTGYTPSISINNKGDVVEAHMGKDNGIWSRFGTIDTEEVKIKWQQDSNAQVIGTSLDPAIAINNKGEIVLIHSEKDNR